MTNEEREFNQYRQDIRYHIIIGETRLTPEQIRRLVNDHLLIVRRYYLDGVPPGFAALLIASEASG